MLHILAEVVRKDSRNTVALSVAFKQRAADAIDYAAEHADDIQEAMFEAQKTYAAACGQCGRWTISRWLSPSTAMLAIDTYAGCPGGCNCQDRK